MAKVKVRTIDLTGSTPTLKSIGMILRTLSRGGNVLIKNSAEFDANLVLYEMGAALQRRFQRDWRHRGLTEEEWQVIREAARKKWKAT